MQTVAIIGLGALGVLFAEELSPIWHREICASSLTVNG